MHRPSLPTTTKPRRGAKPAPAPVHPPHLNFTFRDWLRQRTEHPRSHAGWTPVEKLYADYADWCAATDAPAEYVHSLAAFSGMLRAHDDREPETRLVEERGIGNVVTANGYRLCFPRHLMPPIRVRA